MNSVLQKRNSFMGIDFALFSLLLTILLQWIVLIEVAGFLVRPFHISMILLFVSIFFNRNLLTYTRGVLRTGYYFFAFILFFILMEMLSLLWTENISSGISSILRLFLYVLMAFSLVIKLTNVHSSQIIKTIFWGSLFGVIVFLFTINIYLKSYGINFIADYYTALASRNLFTVVNFFRKFYYIIGGGDLWNTDILRHSLSGLFIIFSLLFRLTIPIMKESFKNKSFLTIIEALLYSFSVLIVLMSLSRSEMLALLMVFGVLLFIKVLSGKLKAHIVLTIILISLCGVFLVIFYGFRFSMIEIFWERFVLIKDDSRIGIYRDALISINEHAFLGLGLATRTQNDESPHNFLLTSWLQLGIGGLLLGTLIYAVLLLHWFQQIVRLITRPHSWVIGIAPEPVMALPIVPLIRMSVEGRPFQSSLEWFALGLFFGFIFANERTLRRQNFQMCSTHAAM